MLGSPRNGFCYGYNSHPSQVAMRESRQSAMTYMVDDQVLWLNVCYWPPRQPQLLCWEWLCGQGHSWDHCQPRPKLPLCFICLSWCSLPSFSAFLLSLESSHTFPNITVKHSSDHKSCVYPVTEVLSSNFTVTAYCRATVTQSGPENCPEQDKLSGKWYRQSWTSSSVEG